MSFLVLFEFVYSSLVFGINYIWFGILHFLLVSNLMDLVIS